MTDDYGTRRLAAAAPVRAGIRGLDLIRDPLARAVLALHRRTPEKSWGQWWLCSGCDVDGPEAMQPTWPCRTVRLVAEHHGIVSLDAAGLFDRPQDGSLDAPTERTGT